MRVESAEESAGLEELKKKFRKVAQAAGFLPVSPSSSVSPADGSLPLASGMEESSWVDIRWLWELEPWQREQLLHGVPGRPGFYLNGWKWKEHARPGIQGMVQAWPRFVGLDTGAIWWHVEQEDFFRHLLETEFSEEAAPWAGRFRQAVHALRQAGGDKRTRTNRLIGYLKYLTLADTSRPFTPQQVQSIGDVAEIVARHAGNYGWGADHGLDSALMLFFDLHQGSLDRMARELREFLSFSGTQILAYGSRAMNPFLVTEEERVRFTEQLADLLLNKDPGHRVGRALSGIPPWIGLDAQSTGLLKDGLARGEITALDALLIVMVTALVHHREEGVTRREAIEFILAEMREGLLRSGDLPLLFHVAPLMERGQVLEIIQLRRKAGGLRDPEVFRQLEAVLRTKDLGVRLLAHGVFLDLEPAFSPFRTVEELLAFFTLRPGWLTQPPPADEMERFIRAVRLLPPLGGKIPLVIQGKPAGPKMRDKRLPPFATAEEQCETLWRFRREGKLGREYVHQLTVQGRMPDEFKYAAVALILSSPYPNDWKEPFFQAPWGKVAPMVHDGGNVESWFKPEWEVVDGRTDFLQRVAVVYEPDLEELEAITEVERQWRFGEDPDLAERYAKEQMERDRLALEARAYQRLALALHAARGTAPKEIPEDLRRRLAGHWAAFKEAMDHHLGEMSSEGEMNLKGVVQVRWFLDTPRKVEDWPDPRYEADFPPIQAELIRLNEFREKNRALYDGLRLQVVALLKRVTDDIDRDIGLLPEEKTAAGLEEAVEKYRRQVAPVRAAMERLGVGAALSPGEAWFLAEIADRRGYVMLKPMDQRLDDWIPEMEGDAVELWKARYPMAIASELVRQVEEIDPQTRKVSRRERPAYDGEVAFVLGRAVLEHEEFRHLREGRVPPLMKDHLPRHTTLEGIRFLAQGEDPAALRWLPAQQGMTVREALEAGAVGYKTNVMLPVLLPGRKYSPYWETLAQANRAWVGDRAQECAREAGGLGVGYVAGMILWAAPPLEFAPSPGEGAEIRAEMEKEDPERAVVARVTQAWLKSPEKAEIESGPAFSQAHGALVGRVVREWAATPGITLIMTVGPHLVREPERWEEQSGPAEAALAELAADGGARGKLLLISRGRPMELVQKELEAMARAGLLAGAAPGRSLLRSFLDRRTGRFVRLGNYLFQQRATLAAVQLLQALDGLADGGAPGAWAGRGIAPEQAAEIVRTARGAQAGLEEPGDDYRSMLGRVKGIQRTERGFQSREGLLRFDLEGDRFLAIRSSVLPPEGKNFLRVAEGVSSGAPRPRRILAIAAGSEGEVNEALTASDDQVRAPFIRGIEYRYRRWGRPVLTLWLDERAGLGRREIVLQTQKDGESEPRDVLLRLEIAGSGAGLEEEQAAAGQAEGEGEEAKAALAERVGEAVSRIERNTAVFLKSELFDPEEAAALADPADPRMTWLGTEIRRILPWPDGREKELQIVVVSEENRKALARLYNGWNVIEVTRKAGTDTRPLPLAAVAQVVVEALAAGKDLFEIDTASYDVGGMTLDDALENLSDIFA